MQVVDRCLDDLCKMYKTSRKIQLFTVERSYKLDYIGLPSDYIVASICILLTLIITVKSHHHLRAASLPKGYQ